MYKAQYLFESNLTNINIFFLKICIYQKNIVFLHAKYNYHYDLYFCSKPDFWQWKRSFSE